MNKKQAIEQAVSETTTVYGSSGSWFYNAYSPQHNAWRQSLSYHSYNLARSDRKWSVVGRALQLLLDDAGMAADLTFRLHNEEDQSAGMFTIEKAVTFGLKDSEG